MVQINWTIQARNDLKDISYFISKDSKQYAKLQINRIRAKSLLLKSHINAGKIVFELDEENIYELIEGNYRIIYLIVNKFRVDILTIHHAARDLTKRTIFK